MSESRPERPTFWIVLSVVLLLVAVGLGVWAITAERAKDDAQQELASLQKVAAAGAGQDDRGRAGAQRPRGCARRARRIAGATAQGLPAERDRRDRRRVLERQHRERDRAPAGPRRRLPRRRDRPSAGSSAVRSVALLQAQREHEPERCDRDEREEHRVQRGAQRVLRRRDEPDGIAALPSSRRSWSIRDAASPRPRAQLGRQARRPAARPGRRRRGCRPSSGRTAARRSRCRRRSCRRRSAWR